MFVILISLILLLLLRVPIGFCLLLSSLSYILYVGNIPWAIMTQRLVGGVDSFTLMAVPFFILAGQFMNAAKITDRLFDFARALVGHIPGGLGHANVVASIFFAGMSGAAVADAGGLGSIEIEAMKKDGYSVDYAAAITAASSTIGPIIPPSIPMIVFGVFAETSVAALFAAGIIPGLLMGVFLMILIYRHAVIKGYKRYPMISFLGFCKAFISAIPPLLTPLILVGGIFGGIFTPTEAGAVAALYALVLGVFFYKTLDFKTIKEVILNSAWTTGIVMIVAMGASLFSYVITLEKIPVILGELILSLTENRYIILLIINLFLLFIGCFLEPISAMIIFLPMFIPLCAKLEINMVHFGVMMILNLMIGLLTPPVGLVLFVVSDVAKISFERLVRTTFPFLLPLLAVLAIVTYIEDVCLWLPRLFGFL
jgi:tripartite ATP-independent transporter DctM subunit